MAYVSDPEESNYYTVRDKARKDAEKLLGKKPGTMIGGTSKKSQALYEVKLGLHYNDKEYAEKKLQEYVSLGGNARGLKQSLKSLDPLKSIPNDKRQAYYNSLNKKEKERVRRAYDFYKKVLLDNVNPDGF
ncbi:TPA: hypothetical protein REU56_002929 [Listeria monocytogenes]|nr:hypothetical protein [Listeria monocytogenes]